MSTYISPVFDRAYPLKFEKFREDRQLDVWLKEIVALRNKNPSNIQTQEFQAIFDACLKKCGEEKFRMGYRLLAFAAFSGINEYAAFPGEVGTALLYALYDERADLELIDELMLAVLKERVSSFDEVLKKIERIRKFNIGVQQSNTPQWHWAIELIATTVEQITSSMMGWMPKKSGEDWIKFNHGGGFQSIYHLFLLRDWNGYECDSMIDGVWVTPFDTGYERRDRYYAGRTPLRHFDTPCVLTGEIQRKYFIICPNEYEVKIPPRYMDKIRNISIQAFPEQISRNGFPVLSYVNLTDKVSTRSVERFKTLFNP